MTSRFCDAVTCGELMSSPARLGALATMMHGGKRVRLAQRNSPL